MTNAITPTVPKGFALRGWHVLLILCSFFGVVFAVDGVFTYLALKTHPGEVSVTPYEDGLLYNKRIAQFAAQERLGWQADAAAERGRVLLEFQDKAGAPISGLAIQAKLERPATETGRRVPRFVQTAPGRYEAQIGPISGAWDLTAEARDRRGDSFLAERRLSWP